MDFTKGLIAKRHEKAPDFVICGLSFKKDEFIEWLQNQSGEWVNIQILRQKNDKNKLFGALDTFKPEKKDETIPGNTVETGKKKTMPDLSDTKELDNLPF